MTYTDIVRIERDAVMYPLDPTCDILVLRRFSYRGSVRQYVNFLAKAEVCSTEP